MRRFHFQLEKVLDYKNQILDNLVGEEAAIMAVIFHIEYKLRQPRTLITP